MSECSRTCAHSVSGFAQACICCHTRADASSDSITQVGTCAVRESRRGSGGSSLGPAFVGMGMASLLGQYPV